MEADKQYFIENEILNLTLFGGLQRAKVYQPTTTDLEKKEFKVFIKKLLSNYKGAYKKKVSIEEHLNNIDIFAKNVTKQFSHFLIGNKLRLGTAQKFFNLYLKYQWALGFIAEPPMFPYDGVIRAELERNTPVKLQAYTKLTDRGRLLEVVKVAEKVVGRDSSLAQWELQIFNKKNY